MGSIWTPMPKSSAAGPLGIGVGAGVGEGTGAGRVGRARGEASGPAPPAGNTAEQGGRGAGAPPAAGRLQPTRARSSNQTGKARRQALLTSNKDSGYRCKSLCEGKRANHRRLPPFRGTFRIAKDDHKECQVDVNRL